MAKSSHVILEPGQITYRSYISEFDGVRALGVGSVLLGHFWQPSISKLVFQFGELAWIAVDGFFVLSGFLIAGILLDRIGRPRYFSTFYFRRTLRIFPVYYLALLLGWTLLRFTNGGYGYHYLIQHWGSPMWFAFYVGNIRTAMVGAWPPSAVYDPLWSLQIEEQFYLLFPLAVAFLRREHLRNLLIGAIVLAPVLRLICYFVRPGNVFLQYTLLPCHCEGLAMGALIALRVRSGRWEISKSKIRTLTLVLIGVSAICSAMSTWKTLEPSPLTLFARLPGYTLASAGFACLLIWIVMYRGSSYTAWLRLPPLQYIGKISYGLYILHPIALMVMLEAARKGWWRFHSPLLFFAACVCLSLALAVCSWHCMELPILQLRSRFGRKQAQPAMTAEPLLSESSQ
ncbi:acyltransferase family protein [Acidicapsa dinghuensis]|uniref:Acyltransferase family protein n=1 Tax=Acidicapsa dinghuensis TaxID=2218256 RepID=A0ABW1ELN1_9BACT|nr:acyltransferase [Acidicapsa dinghuensis]